MDFHTTSSSGQRFVILKPSSLLNRFLVKISLLHFREELRKNSLCIKFIQYNLEISHLRHVCHCQHQIILHAQFIRTFMIYIHIKFYLLSRSGLSVIAVKLTAKKIFLLLPYCSTLIGLPQQKIYVFSKTCYHRLFENNSTFRENWSSGSKVDLK